jgi:hypothetical protein
MNNKIKYEYMKKLKVFAIATIVSNALLAAVSCRDNVPKMIVDKVEYIDTCGWWAKDGDTTWMLHCTIVSYKPAAHEDSVWVAEHLHCY